MALRPALRLLPLSLVAALVRSAAWPAPAPTVLRIITEPEGAEVFIGNVRLGVTPRSGLKVVTQAAGTIICTIRKEGYAPVERSVTFERDARAPLVLRVQLEPATSRTAAAPAESEKALRVPSATAPAPAEPAPGPRSRSSSVVAPSPRSKQGSHKGLILGAVGSAVAGGAGVAVASKRGGTTAASANDPAAATLSGNYTGNVQDSRGGGGAVTLTLTHSTSYVTGTWHGPEPVWRALNGTVNGGVIAATLLPSQSTACPYSLSATVVGSRITGMFSSFNCPAPVSGTVDLTRR
jgi:PEGA domain